MGDDSGVATEDPRQQTAEQRKPEAMADALARALEELRVIASDLRELTSLRLDRAKSGAREAVFRLLILGWVIVAVTAATVVAAYFVVLGIAGGLSALFGGQAWVGRLVGGMAVLSVIAVTVLVVRGRRRRVDLEHLREKYGPSQPPPEDEGTLR